MKLKPGQFRQYDEVLKALGGPAQGYVTVEKGRGRRAVLRLRGHQRQFQLGRIVSSFPSPNPPWWETSGQTLPVIIETGNFQSELTLTNFSASEKNRPILALWPMPSTRATTPPPSA